MPLLRSSLLVALAIAMTAGCGKSDQQRAQERIAQQAAIEKARANSIAEERDKDRLMREGAATEARERLERDAARHEQEVAAAAAAGPSPEQREADRAAALARYTEDLRRAVSDPASMQLRNAELSPKGNGMCAEVNDRGKNGAYAGYKRIVVIDGRVATEEPPVRESLPQFLAFQIAARDSGCFPDVEKVKILQ